MRLPGGWAAVAALDVAGVAVFVAVGRASHDEAASPAGFAATAWPFLCGLAAGWLVTLAWRTPARLWPTGAVVWLVTVAAGMALRTVSGRGTAAAFVVVALVFLGLVMLGWRVAAAAVARRRAVPDDAGSRAR